MPRRPKNLLTSRSLPAALRGSSSVADSLVTGLSVRPLDDGRGAWVVRYHTASGRRRKMTIGRFPTMGLEAAREEASKLLLRVKAGEDPAAQGARDRRGLKAAPTLTTLIGR